jgi:hypothetical protein
MFDAVPATPVNPSAPAMSAITKNVSAQPNMLHLPFPRVRLLNRRQTRLVWFDLGS